MSFRLEEGEIVVLLGPSGCGKTTLLRLAAGLEFPSAGEVLMRRQPIEGPGRDRGMVFQSYSSFPWLTALENVEFPLRYRKEVARRDWHDVAQYFLSLVGLKDFGTRYVSELSGGMQQRLAIARTLASDPDILLMDEPFGALDAQNREFLQEVLLEAQAISKKSILFVTHDVEEAVFLGDRILLMSALPGKMRSDTRPALPKPRRLEDKAAVDFVATKQQLLEQIRKEAGRNGTPLKPIPSGPAVRRDERAYSDWRHKR